MRVDTPQLNVPKDYIVFLLLSVIPSNLGLNSELEQKRPANGADRFMWLKLCKSISTLPLLAE